MKNDWPLFLEKHDSNRFVDFIHNINGQKQLIQQIKNFSNKGDHILEVGCGRGDSAIYFSEHLQVSVLDNNCDVLNHLKQKAQLFSAKISYINSDLLHLTLNKNYKIIYSNGVFEHFSVEELKQLFNHFSKHGELLIFTVPIYTILHSNKTEFGDEKFYTISQWKRIIQNHDFKLIKFIPYSSSLVLYKLLRESLIPTWHKKNLTGRLGFF